METPNRLDNLDVVWLKDEGHFAFLAQRNAHFAIVWWLDRDEPHTLIVEPDDYELWEERTIEFDE